MELIPIIPAWGHTEFIWHNDCHADTREACEGSGRLFGHGNQLSPTREKTYQVLTEMLSKWRGKSKPPTCTSAAMRVRTTPSAPMQGPHGDLRAGNVMVEHFNRLSRIVKDMGKRAMIWADMPFYYPGSNDRLDRNIVMVDWHYDQQ